MEFTHPEGAASRAGLPCARAGAAGILLGLGLLLGAAGCTTSRLPGPQITRVPAGFGLELNASGSRKVFPDREVLNERGWLRSSGERHASILITEFSGSVSDAALIAARDELDRSWGSEHFRYGPVQALRIDGRPAWGWFERQSNSREFVAVVSYPDVSFSIEFYSSMREHQDDALLRAHVQSFRRNPGRLKRILVPLLLIVGIVAVARFGWRAWTSS